jgi:hypothetical protein
MTGRGDREQKRYRTPFRGELVDVFDGRFHFVASGAASGDAVKPYPLIEDLVGPGWRVRMPRAPRVIAPGGTMHVVTRCNE